METLNYRQLADRFPVCPNSESSLEAWQKLLWRWREDGKLEQRKHWRYGPSIEGNNQPTRYYNLAKIVRLICVEARGKMVRPRIGFLYTEYFDEFTEILSNSVATVATVEPHTNSN